MKYPECEKLSKVSEVSQQQGAFLDWLTRQGYVLARWGKNRWDEDRLIPARERTQELLAQYHGIDMAKVDQERRQILAALQSETVAPSDGEEAIG